MGNITFLETGQPLHLYDADKIKGNIKVTKGLKGKMIAIDDQEYAYDENDIVIIDDNGVISLAGVMGSKSTMVDQNTTNVILEVANFNPTTIRKTSHKNNLFTDSSTRFAKGISTDVIKRCVKRLVYNFTKQFDISVGKSIIAGTSDVKPTQIKFDLAMIPQYLGFDIDKKVIEDIFARLGFNLKKDMVTVPPYRVDISIAADLIEEIARVYGYEKLKSEFSLSSHSLIENENQWDFVRKIKNNMVRQGFSETITYSLVNQKKAQDFALVNFEKSATLFKPLSKERETMRHSAINSLIEVAKNNIDRNIKNINIFEVSKMNSFNESFNELSILQYGHLKDDPLYDNIRKASFFTLKTALINLMRYLGIIDSRYQFKVMEQNDFFNHYNSSNVYMGKELVARLGQVHPAIAQDYKLKNIFVAQVNLDILMHQKVGDPKAKAISIFPGVNQDYTIDVPIETNISTLISLAKKSSKLITNIKVVSIYSGDKIDKSLKAITLNIEYNNSQDTIKENEIKEFRNAFISLCSEANFTIRD